MGGAKSLRWADADGSRPLADYRVLPAPADILEDAQQKQQPRTTSTSLNDTDPSGWTSGWSQWHLFLDRELFELFAECKRERRAQAARAAAAAAAAGAASAGGAAQVVVVVSDTATAAAAAAVVLRRGHQHYQQRHRHQQRWRL